MLPKNEAEFVERYRHELLGMMLDAVVAIRGGAQLAVWCRSRAKWTDDLLASIWRDAHERYVVPTIDEAVDELLVRLDKVSVEEKEKIKAKLRAAFKTEVRA